MALNGAMNSAINDVCVTVGAAGREIDSLIEQLALDADIRNLPERKQWSEEMVLAHHEYRRKIEAILDKIFDLES